ncbi:hypothetical protein [Bosea sp. NPDC055594]
MRDGQGNKLSPEEQQRTQSIQGAPDKDSLKKVSIRPDADKDTGEADKPKERLPDKPAAGPGE